MSFPGFEIPFVEFSVRSHELTLALEETRFSVAIVGGAVREVHSAGAFGDSPEITVIVTELVTVFKLERKVAVLALGDGGGVDFSCLDKVSVKAGADRVLAHFLDEFSIKFMRS